MEVEQDQDVDRLNDLLRGLRLHSDINRETGFPLHWNRDDCHQHIVLSDDMFTATYVGPGQTHNNASSVRANFSIDPSVGIYYFEIEVVSMGQYGYLGIGLSMKSTNLNRLPGWDFYSYGYHGNDGLVFNSSGKGDPYGPSYSNGDVVGCGIHFSRREIFFTKNGQNLGPAVTNEIMIPIENEKGEFISMEDPLADLYPTVGLMTMGGVLSANFGQKPFKYDIDTYVRNNQF
uniref:B30.2/SPRY domain-containing protein n=1 Tax=Acrobeloides nanus TaxID=290746 RepID=A0A914DRK6_9BILA